MRAGGWVETFGDDPFAATRLRRVQRLYLGRSRIKTPCNREWYAALSPSDRYAVAWAFTRFLIETVGLRPVDLCSATLDDDSTFVGYDQRFAAFCINAKFDWHETSRSLEWRADGGLQIGFADDDASAWRVGRFWRNGERISGRFTILANPGRAAQVLLAKAADGYLVVSFKAGAGIRLGWQSPSRSSRMLMESSTLLKIQRGREYRFQIDYRRDRIVVFLDGQRVLSSPLGEKHHGHRWGLGASAGAAIRWSDLTLSPDSTRR